jgi:hypothetical protein
VNTLRELFCRLGRPHVTPPPSRPLPARIYIRPDGSVQRGHDARARSEADREIGLLTKEMQRLEHRAGGGSD